MITAMIIQHRCHSKVGRTGGQQLLSLGPGCHDVGSTLHELSHAIGLYHEVIFWVFSSREVFFLDHFIAFSVEIKWSKMKMSCDKMAAMR